MTLKSDKLKRAMAVVLILFFVMSVTVVTVSAKPGHGQERHSFTHSGQVKNTVVNNIQTNLAIVVAPVITIVNVIALGNAGNIAANVGVGVNIGTGQTNSIP